MKKTNEILQDALSDKSFVMDNTEILEIINEDREEIQELLNNEDYINNQTAVLRLIENKYDLKRDSINNLNNFKSKAANYHRENIKVRKRTQLIEAVSISILGAVITLGVVSFWDLIIQINSQIIGYLIVLLLGVVGISLCVAGLSGIQTNIKNDF